MKFFLLLPLIFGQSAFPCSFVASPSHWRPFYAHNEDMNTEVTTQIGGFAMSKRGLHRRGLVFGATSNLAEWTARYASVSFNNMGPGQPFSGINEKGLFMVFHNLFESKYPGADDPRPALNTGQFIQYNLDRSATIEDVIRSGSEVRPSSSLFPMHYMACDASRACVALEYIDGNLLVYKGKDLPYLVMTNDQVPVSVRAAETCNVNGCNVGADTPWKSLWRYAELANLWKTATAPKQPLQNVFWSWLDHAWEQPDSPLATRFQVVYDVNEQKIFAKHWLTKKPVSVTYSFKNSTCVKGAKDNQVYVRIEPHAQGDLSANFHTPSREELIDLSLQNLMPRDKAELIADSILATACE